MAMQALREGASAGFWKFILFGLLVLATAGLVLTDVGGFFRGGLGQTDVVKVGSQSIHINTFDRTVQRTLRRTGMTPQEAYDGGFMDQLVRQEIQQLVMRQAALDYGINIGRVQLAQAVNDIVEPLSGPDATPQDMLQQILFSQGMNEEEFAQSVKTQVSTNILINAIQPNIGVMSDSFVRDIYLYQNESRSVQFFSILAESVTDIGEPTDSELQILYSEQKESFASPERRSIQLGILDAQQVKERLEITEERLREDYENHLESYKIDERRVVEQAIIEDKIKADDVVAAVQEGRALKQVLADHDLPEDNYIPENTFEKSDFDGDVRTALFDNASKGDVVGPLESAFGWQVYVIQDIEEPRTQSFEEIKEELKEELLTYEAGEQIYELATQMDDMLAGGATLEEVTDPFSLTVSKISNFDRNGQIETTIPAPADRADMDDIKTSVDAFSAFSDDDQTLLEIAYELQEGEISIVTEISGGRFAVVQMDEIQPKSYKPFEEVTEQLGETWSQQQRVNAVRQKAEALKGRVESGEQMTAIASADDQVKLYAHTLTRGQSEFTGGLLQNTIPIVFNASVGDVVIGYVNGGLAVIMITGAEFPENIDDEKFAELKGQLEEEWRNSSLPIFSENRRQKYGAAVNDNLIRQVYGRDPLNNPLMR